jgi:hypothetical protein
MIIDWEHVNSLSQDEQLLFMKRALREDPEVAGSTEFVDWGLGIASYLGANIDHVREVLNRKGPNE